MIPYGIRSVVGFGGVLPGGMLFVIVLFSTVPIPAPAADAFAAIALSTKFALLAHVGGPTFVGQPAPARSRSKQAALTTEVTDSKIATLLQLLDARALVVEREAQRLELEAARAEEHAAELAASKAALEMSEARKTAILEGALDCIIGMDADGRITDFNHAAETTFGYDRREAAGQVLAELLIPQSMRERHRLGLADHLLTGQGPVIGRRIEVNALRRDGSEFPVEVTITQIAGTGPPQFSGSLRDISHRRLADAELATNRERLAHIARTLQTSFLPPNLPAIDGIDLAAAFRASGDGYEVGGDYYDAFELGRGQWALTLGDVCGKGSDAAVITALSRYTVRAAAMRNQHPASVLATLNAAVHRQHPDTYSTAVYLVLDPTSGEIELALGGHPHPVLLDPAGRSPWWAPGSLLGPLEGWTCTEETLTLSEGDTLILYSDGLTDARAGQEFYGDARLLEVLRSCRGLSAESLVTRIETDVVDFAGSLRMTLPSSPSNAPALFRRERREERMPPGLGGYRYGHVTIPERSETWLRSAFFCPAKSTPQASWSDDAIRAEAVGFRSVLVSDHYHPWLDSQGHSPFVWSVLGGIASTTQLTITTGVTCPTVRIHPAVIA